MNEYSINAVVFDDVISNLEFIQQEAEALVALAKRTRRGCGKYALQDEMMSLGHKIQNVSEYLIESLFDDIADQIQYTATTK